MYVEHIHNAQKYKNVFVPFLSFIFKKMIIKHFTAKYENMAIHAGLQNKPNICKL